ncbi:L-threonine dehydratase catabolic TdcB [Fusarium oxysporum f. sp. albedinis]|nr:L-threonine dehydratase catabolic TdcB [Fusarium oxysporum f. sp. albedinis]
MVGKVDTTCTIHLHMLCCIVPFLFEGKALLHGAKRLESNDGNFDRSLLYHKVDVWEIYSWDIETVEKEGLREAFYTWSDPLNQDM